MFRKWSWKLIILIQTLKLLLSILSIKRKFVSIGEYQGSIKLSANLKIVLLSILLLLPAKLKNWSVKLIMSRYLMFYLFFGFFMSKLKTGDLIFIIGFKLLIGVNKKLNLVVINLFFWGNKTFLNNCYSSALL